MRRFLKRIGTYLSETFFSESERFVLFVPVLFGLGTGLYFLFKTEPPLWIAALVVEGLLLIVFLVRSSYAKLLFFSALLITAFGFVNAMLHSVYIQKHISLQEDGEVTYLAGHIIQKDVNAKGKIRLLMDHVRDFDYERKGLYKITLESKKSALKVGDCAEMATTLRKPSAPAMIGGYDYARSAFFEKISAIGYANSFAYKIKCPYQQNAVERVREFVGKLRQQMVAKMTEALPEKEASIAAAIIAGDKSLIDEETYRQYRDSGLAHFLAISGLHMGLVGAMTFFMVRLLMALIPALALRYNSKKVAAVFAIALSFIYLLISGMAIPSERAFLMSLIVLIGVLMDRTAISMRMVAFAAMVLLLIAPQALVSASFQMSFAAVVCLIAFYESVRLEVLNAVKKNGFLMLLLIYFLGIMITDVVASLATMPYTIYHFGQIAPYTLLANLAAGPIIGFVIMPFVLISLLTVPLGIMFPLKIAGFGLGILNKITAYVSSLPNAGLRVESIPLWGLVLITLGGLWLCFWQKKWRYLGLVLIVCGMLGISSLERPDVVFEPEGKHFLLKDEKGEMFYLSTGRAKSFLQEAWLKKYGGYKLSKTQEKNFRKKKKVLWKADFADLMCRENVCTYKKIFSFDMNRNLKLNGKPLNSQEKLGGEIDLKTGKIKSVRAKIGRRPWNEAL